jgi:hypothetical protein
MNERIRQLVEQAFIITTDGKIGHVNNYMVEKFAELIVRECIAVHEDDYGVDIIGDVLKKHFGLDSEDDVEYCPSCNAEWSGTSCGLDNCGWIVGVEE